MLSDWFGHLKLGWFFMPRYNEESMKIQIRPQEGFDPIVKAERVGQAKG